MNETSPVGRAPAVVVFDVNETLSDLTPLRASFESVGLAAESVEPWFAGLLRDGFALTCVGVNPAFADLARESLRIRLLGSGVTPEPGSENADDAVERVMSGFTSLPVHPDVVEGVRALQSAGIRLVTLTNGSTSVAEGLLERAGLADAFERLMSVESAGAWKPHPSSYAYALGECGVSAGEAILVAVHPWDIDGAARAGLRTGWLNRSGGSYPSYFRRPELEVGSLVELAHAWEG
ncbi:MAG TPA: haloacid dehalogenase type II [Nocardioides sp.]|uniref:haloacid dehalogenase type II n=1 Tax=Nocardioides sp. TaxID=35761 RepID=UPI002F409910